MSASKVKYSGRMMFRHFRRVHRMTQKELGLALGCTTRHVKFMEAGERVPSAELMERFKSLVRLHEEEKQKPQEPVAWLR